MAGGAASVGDPSISGRSPGCLIRRELAVSRSWRAAADTPAIVVITPDTLLALRCVTRVLTADWSLVRADLRFWICPLHRLPAELLRLDRFDFTCCTAVLSSSTVHTAAETDAGGAAAPDEGLPADAAPPGVLPPEPQAAASSTRLGRRTFRQARRLGVTLLILSERGGRRPSPPHTGRVISHWLERGLGNRPPDGVYTATM